MAIRLPFGASLLRRRDVEKASSTLQSVLGTLPPGATTRDLTNLASVMGVKPQIWDVDESGRPVQFGPGQPPQEQPIGGDPRQWVYRPGWNLPTLPGEGKLASWDTLKNIPAVYEVAGKAMQIRADEIANLHIDLIARDRDTRRARETLRKQAGLIAEIKDAFAYPDKRVTWAAWIRKIIRERLTTDATTVFIQRNFDPSGGPQDWGNPGQKKGKADAYLLVDGSTVKPLVDAGGRTPLPPAPAYQQFVYGVARGSYTTQDLYYAPCNVSNYSPYGFCYDSETEILTREGWKHFADLAADDEVATRSADGEFQWQRPTAHVNQPYSGKMLHFRSQVYDLLVTPNHRMLVRYKRSGTVKAPWQIREASFFAEKPKRALAYEMPATSRWTGESPERFTLPAAERKKGRHHPAPTLDMPAHVWATVLGLFIAEGTVPAAAGHNANAVQICQSPRSRHHGGIAELLDQTGVRWSYLNSNWRFQVNHGPLADHLRKHAYSGGKDSASKRIPGYAKQWSPELLTHLVNGMMMGDGHVEASGLRRYTTVSAGLADDLCEVAQKMGGEGWISRLKLPLTLTPINGGQPMKSVQQQYRVSLRPGDVHRVPEPTSVDYDGTIHCVTVPNGIVYVRRNGRPAWCGNSEVEQALMHINLALKFWQSQSARYTDGTLPEGVGEAPPEWTTAQIAEFNDWWDKRLAGDVRALRKMNFVPHGFTWHDFKGDDFNENLARYIFDVTCVCFDVTPMEMGMEPSHGGLGGKGLGETMTDVSERRSIRPTLSWLFDNLLNPIIWNEYGATDLEWAATELDEQSEKEHAEAQDTNLRNGRISLDELIEEDGGTPIGVGRLFVIGNNVLGEPDLKLISTQGALAAGYLATQMPVITDQNQQFGPDGQPVQGDPNDQNAQPGQADAQQPTSAAQSRDTGLGGGEPDDTGPAKHRDAELKRWETKAARAAKTGKRANVTFQSDHIPVAAQQLVRSALSECETAAEVRSVFSDIRSALAVTHEAAA